VESVKKILPELRSASDFIIGTFTWRTPKEALCRDVSGNPPRIGGHNHDALGPFWLGQTMVAKTGVSGQNSAAGSGVPGKEADEDGRKLIA